MQRTVLASTGTVVAQLIGTVVTLERATIATDKLAIGTIAG